MAPRPSKSLLTLLIEDRGARLLTQEGALVGVLPDAASGQARQEAWAQALRDLAPPGSQIQILMAHSTVTVQCQDAPYLSVREQRDVALRLTAVDEGVSHLAYAAALDTDKTSESGHVLWVAMHPRIEMVDWLEAIKGAGLTLAHALPLQRAVVRSLESYEDLPQGRFVLSLEPGHDGHLFIFRGHTLFIMRSFHLPEGVEELDELVYEEVSRLLQFIKQKHRGLVFDSLLVVGVSALSPPFATRLQGSLRLVPRILVPSFWPFVQQGMRLERNRKDGLNLVPIEEQEALQRKLFKATVWIASVLVLLLFGAAGALLTLQERALKQAATQAEENLTKREQATAQEALVVDARVPLVRLKLAEKRQVEAMAGLSKIMAALLQTPNGVVIDKVEVSEIAGEKVTHHFTVSGTALTEKDFSVGPLAQYLMSLDKMPGVMLNPIKDISISDRMDDSSKKLDQQAITRFTFEGTAAPPPTISDHPAARLTDPMPGPKSPRTNEGAAL